MALTLRLESDEEKELLENLKKITGNKSGTKAFMDSAKIAVYDVPDLKENINKLREEIESNEEINSDLIYIIRRHLNLIDEIQENKEDMIKALEKADNN